MLLFMYAFVKKRRDLLSFTYSTVCKPDITQKIKLQMLESKLIFSRDVTFFKHAIIVNHFFVVPKHLYRVLIRLKLIHVHPSLDISFESLILTLYQFYWNQSRKK